jgi:cation diffusion facilitator family transporter
MFFRSPRPLSMELLESNRSIVAAVAANVAIAVIKLIAGGLSGSSSMTAEGIHSLVDMGNGLILLHGVRASLRPPDRAHPFGHGQEVYFWTLIVAVIVFGLGGGVSAYEGFQRLGPHEIRHFGLTLGVLGASLLFEAASFSIALREFRADNPAHGLWSAIKLSKDPSRFAVLFEDSAAIAGVLVAAAALLLARLLRASWIDAAGSIVIGGILAAAAVALSRQARRLLLGEGLSAAKVAALSRRLSRDEAVAGVDALLSMYIGPRNVLLAARVVLRRTDGRADVAKVRARLKRSIAEAAPEVTHTFLELDPPREGRPAEGRR